MEGGEPWLIPSAFRGWEEEEDEEGRRDWLREIKFKVVLIASSSSGSPPCKLARRDEEGGVMHSVEREREREREEGERGGERRWLLQGKATQVGTIEQWMGEERAELSTDEAAERKINTELVLPGTLFNATSSKYRCLND